MSETVDTTPEDPEAPAGPAAVTDANQLRGREFSRLIRKAKTWILILAGTLILTAIGFVVAPFIGGIAFAAGLLLGVVITFFIADNRAEEAFYRSYAESRGMEWKGQGQLGGATPLLRRGDERKADEVFTGPLADGFEGTLALYTYTEVSRDSDGNRQETDYPFTLILVDLPETVDHLPELIVQRKFGFKALEKFEDKFRMNHERVTLESEALRDRYEIFVGKDQDEVWVRRLFSPSFIVWLTDSPPEKFAFELVGGKLCAFVPKHRDSIEGFDEIIATGCEVARRLREESAGT
jgi:hypothetical protein